MRYGSHLDCMRLSFSSNKDNYIHLMVACTLNDIVTSKYLCIVVSVKVFISFLPVSHQPNGDIFFIFVTVSCCHKGMVMISGNL